MNYQILSNTIYGYSSTQFSNTLNTKTNLFERTFHYYQGRITWGNVVPNKNISVGLI